jgi:hypothetical protein
MPSILTLDHFSYCRFLTNIAQPWTDDHYNARAIVRAIKGEPFSGYASLKVNNAWQTLDAAHPQVAFDWFADRVAIETPFPLGGMTLCPIPDSECTLSAGKPSRTMPLADTLVERIPGLEIWDGLRFERPMQKSRDTNMRDMLTLFEALLARSDLPSGPIILLDDVCTTGAHARAAAHLLKDKGARTLFSMSVARTMLNRDEQVFGFRQDLLGPPALPRT